MTTLEDIIEVLKQLPPERLREAHRIILTFVVPALTEEEIATRMHEAHDKPADLSAEAKDDELLQQFIARINEGIRQSENGETLTETEVRIRLGRWLTPSSQQ